MKLMSFACWFGADAADAAIERQFPQNYEATTPEDAAKAFAQDDRGCWDSAYVGVRDEADIVRVYQVQVTWCARKL